MTKTTRLNAANERIKREYFRYLAEAKGRDEATIDGVAKALARFEASTRGRDFQALPPRAGGRLQERLGRGAHARTASG
jgi:hypothetical protein